MSQVLASLLVAAALAQPATPQAPAEPAAFCEADVEIMSPSYFALRDGNGASIPEEQRPRVRTAAFRVDVNPT